MLQITIPPIEDWDEEKNCFVSFKGQTLQLEHSLISLSKWEAKWKKPFIGSKDLSPEETRSYIECMTLTQNVKPDTYSFITQENMRDIVKYISEDQTATWFSGKKPQKRSRKVITSELIYYWMIAYGIPFQCSKWHLSRLITLIRVCEEENKPKNEKKRKPDLASRSKLNAARRKRLGTRG